jgi:hypothetical protein
MGVGFVVVKADTFNCSLLDQIDNSHGQQFVHLDRHERQIQLLAEAGHYTAHN